MFRKVLLVGAALVSLSMLSACDQNPNNQPAPPATPSPSLVLVR
ncbi:MAG: hypothetical protein ACT4OG_00140 [Alphaproteobacteria bacterium]